MNQTPSASLAEVQPDAATKNFILSVLQGLAILGLLITGIWGFAGFTDNERAFYTTSAHHGNYKLFALVSLLFDGKMISLLALVFGADIILFLQRKEEPGSIHRTDAYIRRQIWFIIFGLFLALVVISPGDLLFPFGVVGILLFAFWKLPVKGLLIAAFLCMLIYCGKNYWNYTGDIKDYKKYLAVKTVEKKFTADSIARAKKFSTAGIKDSVTLKSILAQKKIADSLAKKNDTLTNKQSDEKEKWEGIIKGRSYSVSKTNAENKVMRSGYSKIWFHLKGQVQNKESAWLYSSGVWDLGSMMLLGMALIGAGFFNRRFSSSTYFFLSLVLIVAGVALGWLRIHGNSLRLVDYAQYIDQHFLPYNQFVPLEQMLLATGYASFVISIISFNPLRWIWLGLSAVGRMTFTNYILQTLICTFYFYGYGLGYFGRFQQWELYFVVAEITLVQVVFSVIWLRNYQMGPFEWLLNSLIHRRKLPMKKETAF